MMKWVRCALRGTVVGTVVIGGLVASTGCRKEARGSMMPPMPSPLVSVAAAQSRDVPLYLDEIGKANASETVTIMPQVAGRVDAPLKFTDGADLKAGQVLFTIDSRPFVALVDQAEAQLEKDKAGLANAEQYLKRQEDIYKQGFVAPSDYDTAVSNVKSDKGAVKADLAAIESAKLNVEYCTIKSPIDGRAGMRLVDPGNVVKINETPLLVIQRIDTIYADFTINESELLKVRREMAGGTLKTMIKLPEDSDYHEGSLTFLDNSVQDGSGTIKLRATLPNSDRHFWPGQFVDVRLVLRVLKDAVLVPTSVPQQSQQGTYALVVKNAAAPGSAPATIAELRPIVLGQRHGDMIIVEKGVAAGERVITDGQMLVRPGGPVSILPPSAPAMKEVPATAPSDGDEIGGDQ